MRVAIIQKLRQLLPGLLWFWAITSLIFISGTHSSIEANPGSYYTAAADTSEYSVRLHADGQQRSLPDSLRNTTTYSSSQGQPVLQAFPKYLRVIPQLLGTDGFLASQLDSVVVNQDRKRLTFYATRGCAYRIGQIVVLVNTSDYELDEADSELFDRQFELFLNSGELYQQLVLEREIRDKIRFWEDEGYMFATATPELDISDADACTVDITITINPGEKVVIADQLFPGLERNQPEFLSRISGIRMGTVLSPAKLRNARMNLENTELFQSVDEVEIIKQQDEYKLLYTVEERRTNAFDLLFGYLPEATGGNNFIGSGDLILRNVFFQGSRLGVSFERLQQFVTKLDLGYEARYIGSSPFGAGVRFRFEQQDTLYQIRNLGLNGRYRLSSSTSVIGTLRQEVSVSGTLPAASQRVFDANSLFTGIGLEYRQTNQLINPSRGVIFRMLAETGIKRITDARVEDFTDRTRWNQQEFEMYMRGFISPFSRQVISPSINGYLMISPEYTESDFNRFGGARSLRGYREDQFQSSRMLWGDVEYRYLLDRLSYAFVFGAAGYYERPEIIFERDLNMGIQSGVLYSYGLGFSYSTPLGIMQFTYALSRDDDFSNGKVHIGITTNL